MPSWRARILASFLLSFVAAGVSAQTTGDIEGRVTEPAGGLLSAATVTAQSPSLQGTRTVPSDRSGVFRIASLPPGDYVIRVSLEGFRPVQKAAVVRLDGGTRVDFVLEPVVAEEIVVRGEAPLLDPTSTTSGTNYTRRVISRLPLSRNYADIVKSNPGVSTDRGDTEGRSLALTVYGATSAENQWIIDGVNTTNVFKGVQGKAINNEFVQEVEVKTGGYQAEYGRALGGVVNVITKSGGNEYHGDAFVYYDSTETAAQQQFLPGDSGLAQMRVTEGERFDFGLDLGGYLVQDRLWFFAAYNRVQLESRVSRLQPSTEVSTDVEFPLDAETNLYSGKLTWNVGGSTTIVGTVFADPSKSSGASGADPAHQGLGVSAVVPPVSLDPATWYSERSLGGTDFGIRATHLFGANAVLSAQASYHRERNELDAPPGARTEDWTCEGGTPEEPCDDPLEPHSITGGYGSVRGTGDHSESRRSQIAAAFTLYSGNHEIRFGGDHMDGETDARDFYTGDQRVFVRSEYGQRYYEHRFFAVSPDDFTIVPGVELHARVLDYGVFAQDSWRVLPNLTINAGLRWDGETTQNYLNVEILRFTKEWQPRLGVVWDPWKDGATKLYAFAGRFSYALPTLAASVIFGGSTGIATYNFDPVGVAQDPGVIGHEESFVRFTGTFGTPVDPDVRGWYQDELTVGIERLLDPTLTVGLKGTYRTLENVLEDRCDLDYNDPAVNSSCGMVNLGSDGPMASGNVGTCNGLDDPYRECGINPGPATPPVERVYRGLELFGRKSFGDDLWVQASYVYSSLKGNYDGGVNQGASGQTWPGVNADFDYPQMSHNAEGTLSLDRTHAFRMDGFWVTPWRLSIGLQGFAVSGAPMNRLGYLNFFYSTHLVPRGSEGRMPTQWGANLTLSYPIVVGPATVTFQAYLFNVFNEQIAAYRNEEWSIEPPPDYPDSLYDPNQEQNNPDYGKVTGRTDPRLFRAAVKISF